MKKCKYCGEPIDPKHIDICGYCSSIKFVVENNYNLINMFCNLHRKILFGLEGEAETKAERALHDRRI